MFWTLFKNINPVRRQPAMCWGETTQDHPQAVDRYSYLGRGSQHEKDLNSRPPILWELKLKFCTQGLSFKRLLLQFQLPRPQIKHRSKIISFHFIQSVYRALGRNFDWWHSQDRQRKFWFHLANIQSTNLQSDRGRVNWMWTTSIRSRLLYSQ